MVRGIESLGLERDVPLHCFARLVWEACSGKVQPAVSPTLLVAGPGHKLHVCLTVRGRRVYVGGQR